MKEDCALRVVVGDLIVDFEDFDGDFDPDFDGDLAAFRSNYPQNPKTPKFMFKTV